MKKVHLFYLKVDKRKEVKDYGIRYFLNSNYKIMSDNYRGCIPVIREDDIIYILYGFTSNKKTAKLFMNQRKMKWFQYAIKEMPDDDYGSMRNGMFSQELSVCDLNYDSFEKSGDIKIALSKFEEELVTDEMEFVCFIRDTIFMPDVRSKLPEGIPMHIFTSDVRKALNILLYPILSPALIHEDSKDMIEEDVLDSIMYTFQCGRIQKFYTFMSMFENIIREDVILDGAN